MASQDELRVAEALQFAREPVDVDASGERAADASALGAPTHDAAHGKRAVRRACRSLVPTAWTARRCTPWLVVGRLAGDVPQERVVVAVRPADAGRGGRERPLHAKHAVEEDVDAEVDAVAAIGFDAQDLMRAAVEGRAAQPHRGLVVDIQRAGADGRSSRPRPISRRGAGWQSRLSEPWLRPAGTPRPAQP